MLWESRTRGFGAHEGVRPTARDMWRTLETCFAVCVLIRYSPEFRSTLGTVPRDLAARTRNRQITSRTQGMHCLYCKKRLWLFFSKEREFCSKLHEATYHEELSAMNRLMEF